MAKAKVSYYWRGKGGLKIDRLYKTGEKVPHDHEMMDQGTLAALIESGDIKTAPFDAIESSAAVSELEKKVKELSEKLVECNKRHGGDNCKGCVAAADKIIELEGLLEAATTGDEKKD